MNAATIAETAPLHVFPHNPKVTMHQQSEKMATPAASLSLNLDAVPQRVREIAMLRGLGYSFRQIAEQFNVTPQAVSLMLSRHRRCLKALRGSIEMSTLSARAVNALARHGISTREEARRLNAPGLLANARNCGRKILEEVTRWMNEAERRLGHSS
jgi:predicted transcriptional regulator